MSSGLRAVVNAANQPIRVVADEGYKTVRDAIKVLLNQYPGLYPDEKILFETLDTDEGIIFSDNSGALVYSEKKDITDVVHQKCQYPFFVVYRSMTTKERLKLSIQTFLDTLGRWLCQEPVEINGTNMRLLEFPKLSEGREIKRITRENSYGLDPREDGAQDWVLPVTVEYTNEFEL